MTTPLLTAPRLRARAPDPPATVCIRNLATVLSHAAHDAWNRPGKPQPALLSVEVAFAAPFAAAAARDALAGGDTVHYGTLSKAVLGCVARFEAECAALVAERREGEEEEEWTVRDVLVRVWRELTGLGLDGGVEETGEKVAAFLDLSAVRLLSVTVTLPKASLLGEGVSLTASAVFEQGRGRMEARAMALEISKLRVPTLVGVNANERLAKQFVVTTVTVEGFDQREDVYTETEAVVVKALEESSFETLEALGAHIADRVLKSRHAQASWQVCVRMEKPTAVALADCPIVEVRATLGTSDRTG